jgi:hypothetical protein
MLCFLSHVQCQEMDTVSHNSNNPFLHLDSNCASKSETFEKVVNAL